MPAADPNYLKLCHLMDDEGFALHLHHQPVASGPPAWVLIATLPDRRYVSAQVRAVDVGPRLGEMAEAILDRL